MLSNIDILPPRVVARFGCCLVEGELLNPVFASGNVNNYTPNLDHDSAEQKDQTKQHKTTQNSIERSKDHTNWKWRYSPLPWSFWVSLKLCVLIMLKRNRYVVSGTTVIVASSNAARFKNRAYREAREFVRMCFVRSWCLRYCASSTNAYKKKRHNIGDAVSSPCRGCSSYMRRIRRWLEPSTRTCHCNRFSTSQVLHVYLSRMGCCSFSNFVLWDWSFDFHVLRVWGTSLLVVGLYLYTCQSIELLAFGASSAMTSWLMSR